MRGRKAAARVASSRRPAGISRRSRGRRTRARCSDRRRTRARPCTSIRAPAGRDEDRRHRGGVCGGEDGGVVDHESAGEARPPARPIATRRSRRRRGRRRERRERRFSSSRAREGGESPLVEVVDGPDVDRRIARRRRLDRGLAASRPPTTTALESTSSGAGRTGIGRRSSRRAQRSGPRRRR